MTITEDKIKFGKLLLVSALPVTLQNLLQNSLSFIDTLMIGQLGEVEIAAVGLTNQMYFLISVIMFGISSGASIFTSQYWGSKDEKRLLQTFGVAVTLGVLFSSVFSVLSIFFPHLLMKIFIDEKAVVNAGCIYLKCVGISYIFTAISMIISITLRSTGDMKNPMRATFISMVCNVIGNYLLIFTAKLGIMGAAIATTLSRLIELCALIFLLGKSQINFNLRTCFSYDFSFVKRILKTAFPVILDDSLWAIGMTVYKAVYSRMGISVLAASNVTEAVQDIIFVVQIGMGAAISVLIGNEIGKGNEEQANKMARWSIFWVLPVSLACVIIMALIAPFIPYLFNIDSSVKTITTLALFAMSATLPVKFMNHILITGVLRSGGDTKFLLFTEMFSIWCIGVPMAYLSGIVLALPLWAVYLFVALEEVSKVFILTPRTLKGKWITNFTVTR